MKREQLENRTSLSDEQKKDFDKWAIQFICEIPNSRIRQILFYRNVQLLPWNEVANVIGFNNSGDGVRRAYNRFWNNQIDIAKSDLKQWGYLVNELTMWKESEYCYLSVVKETINNLNSSLKTIESFYQSLEDAFLKEIIIKRYLYQMEWKSISSELDMDPETIRMYCRRNLDRSK